MRRVTRTWRTVRVFISSTFKDMHAERDLLVKVVFPELRELLQEYRVHLVDIDLRWGVTLEQSENDLATELCLKQVDDCRPFFIGILGERYGYVPESLSGPTVSKYHRLLDFNGKSVTEMEFSAALIREVGQPIRALFFFRDPAFIDKVPFSKRAEVGAENSVAEKNVAKLKEFIRGESLKIPPMDNYPCSYLGLRVNPRTVGRELDLSNKKRFKCISKDGVVDSEEYEQLDESLRDFIDRHGVVYTTGLEAFSQQVKQNLWQSIQQELKLPDVPMVDKTIIDLLNEEEELHERFMQTRLRVYVERENIQRRLIEYVLSDDRRPLLVTGRSGAGKSALLSRLVKELEFYKGNYLESTGCILRTIIPHFVGSSPGSTSLRKMLRRFCLLLQYDLTIVGGKKDMEQSMIEIARNLPEMTDELIQEFHNLIQKIPDSNRVVIIVDALNQMDATDNAHAMLWLPRCLPVNLRVIVSCTSEPESLIKDQSQIRGFAAAISDVLAAFRHRPYRQIKVKTLTNKQRRAIIHEIPSISAKTLDKKQISLLIRNPSTRNPLFLLVALEELRGFGSFEQIEARIANFPRQGDTLTEIFQQVIERLEEEFGLELVECILSLLACSRYGLSEAEMKELTISTDRLFSERGTLAADLYAILRQIRPYTQYRGNLLDFFHSNFLLAVRKRYLKSNKIWHKYNLVLAHYFRNKADPSGKGSWTGSYPRGLSELPYHLSQAKEIDSLGKLLVDFGFLQAKILGFDPQTLIEDCQMVLNTEIKTSTKVEFTLELLRAALRLCVYQLTSDPTQLLSQLWCRLIYRDEPSIKALLESFRTKATKPWMRLWTPSITSPGPLHWQADISDVRLKYGCPKVSLTHDAGKIIVASGDGSLLVFTPNSAFPIIEIEGDAEAGTILDAVVADEDRKVIVLRNDGSVNVWNLCDQALEQTKQVFNPLSVKGEAYGIVPPEKSVLLENVEYFLPRS